MQFITGTDEHGEKIALAAAAKERAPKEHCDAVAAEYQLLWKEVSGFPISKVSNLNSSMKLTGMMCGS